MAPARLRPAQHSLERADPAVLTAVTGADTLLALVPAPLEGATGMAERLLRALPAGVHPRLHVGGRFAEEEGEVPATARSAGSAADVRRSATGRDGQVHHYDEDPTGVLVAGVTDDWRLRALSEPWRRLAAGDPHGVLAQTVETVLAHDGDLGASATALSVHRNTLRYRLDRIAEISGCDVRRTSGALRLYVGAARGGGVVRVHNDRTSTSG